MFLSIFEIFKVGVGPSSSHTMGPMTAAGLFLEKLKSEKITASSLGASLHGSLAFTGKGHRSDQAVILGLDGFTPDDFDPDAAKMAEERIALHKAVRPEGHPEYAFDPEEDLVFDYETVLTGHANGMKIWAKDEHGAVLVEQIYYSIGGGFVATAEEMEQVEAELGAVPQEVPYPFRNADHMLALAKDSGKSVAQMKWENELIRSGPENLHERVMRIWEVMEHCIDKGLDTGGILPGGLNVKRRAMGIHSQLQAEQGKNLTPPHVINDWIAAYAMAVNEENAAGGQVVTAPTNGAAGVVPATIRYYLDHVPTAKRDDVVDFLLTAAAIGGIIKNNASISGAEVGCQGEVGSASAMAAAGLCAVLGGTPQQVENAAEIALEHHLGMTCDPIKGLVQAPCIERNGLGAIKAVSAASLSLRGDGLHLVSLDACVETMRQTGEDMSDKYKETSLGGLAVNLPAC
ncbi:L-serine ammonia-lyase [Neptunicoccus cionae]|uniref:L-serine dehydratase n=1 Tax=Neptunicoccus cionae TaxID=2035344 RepID=A0A916QU74_9RHOB|nr:L-serine ammonia-lyase [Amylibacter cionae]GGA10145.1 L-serine ammonia-lyase [Amylibacter cionae]